MMDVVKSCETSKTSLTVKMQPTPQTQLQWLEISVWCVKCDPWSDPPSLHVHSPPAEPWPRATFVLYLTARGRQCGTGDSVRSHPQSRTLAVVSGLQHQRGGTRNQEPAPCGHQSPHSSSLCRGPLGHYQMTPAMSTMTDTQARYFVARTSLQLIWLGSNKKT